mgnify:CR=1 FL=1|jgi:hypothetical protein
MSKYQGFKPNRRGRHNEFKPDPKDFALEEELQLEEERPKWRKRHKSLQTKPIYTKQFPDLLRAMYADGLECVLTDDGYQWYVGRYRVSNVAIREMWNLSERQWKRLMQYVYIQGTQWC